MAEQRIDKIEYGGVKYEFVDQTARDQFANLSTRMTSLNDKQSKSVEAEIERAKKAESALENSKVGVEAGKGLSTNDFTDEHKELLEHPAAMTGATSTQDGKQGDVPVPAAGDQGKYLDGSGKWSTPHDTTYELATQKKAGLFSASDKVKLDAMDKDTDDTVSCTTKFGDGTITQTLGNGKTKSITFNEDGSITEVISKSGMSDIRLHTVFGADGSIVRTRT